MKRWTEQHPDLEPRAAAASRLLSRVKAPEPLSDECRARIAAALLDGERPRVAWVWLRRGMLVAGAAVAIIALAPRGERVRRVPASVVVQGPPRPAQVVSPREASTPTVVEPPPSRAVPERAATHPSLPLARAGLASSGSPVEDPRSRTIALRDGELVVDGRDRRVVVETPRARIEVPAGGRARVEVRPDGVRVASLTAVLVVYWIASDARFEVAAGEIWSSELIEPHEQPPAPPPAETSLGDEARLFGEILAARKDDPSGTATLARLDEYARRYPHGTFTHEAQTMRVDALMRGGNWQGALALLDGMPLDELARGVELGVLRGELRVRAGRPRAALADLDRAIARAGGALAERARYDRAAALAAAGDAEAARTALADYLARFPSGRFSAAARAALEKP